MRLAFDTDEAVLPKIDNAPSKTIGVDSTDLAALVKSGISAAQKGERSRARALLIRATEIDATSEDAWMWLASISEFPEELLAFLNNALEINPKNKKAKEWKKSTLSLMAKTFVQRGIAAHETRAFTTARQCFEQALSIDTHCEMAWFWKASVVESTEEKVVCLEKVLRLNPDNTDAVDALKIISSERVAASLMEAKRAAAAGNPASADEMIFAILMESPNNAEAWFLKSFLTNVVDEKVAALEKSLEFEPDNILARMNLEFLTDLITNAGNSATQSVSPEVENTPEIEATEPPEPQMFTENSFESMPAASEPTVEEPAQEPVMPSEPFEQNGFVQTETDNENGNRNYETILDVFSTSNAATDELTPQPEFDQTLASIETSRPATKKSSADRPRKRRTAHDMFGDATTAAEADPEMETVDNLHTVLPAVDDEPAYHTADFSQETAESFQTEHAVEDSSEPMMADDDLLEVPNDPLPTPDQNPSRTVAFTADEFAAVVRSETPCPYCDAKNDPQALECGSCRALLTLADIEALLSGPHGEREMIRNGVIAKEALWNSQEFNSDEFIELGIGHFNLGSHEFGFKYLQEASRLDPNNVILAGHVNKIAIRLEEMRRQEEIREAMPKGKTILVVDDSPTVRKLISGKLEKSGHNVVCAVDGVEGLARIEELMPDLVLLDINMPKMDGYQVCKEIRANPEAKDLPVVMISGKDGFFDKVRGRMAGSTGYITKPFGPETLMKALETYLLPDPVSE